MRVDYFYNEEQAHKYLALIFSPATNRKLDGNLFGGEVFLRNGYDTIVVKISNDDYFQSLPSNLFETINIIATKKNYEKIVSYGSSMGGYASIAFSKLLKCTAAIAISPKFNIDEDFYTRFPHFSEKIDFKYRISKDSVSTSCKFCILYDNKDPDEMHVRKILEVIPDGNIKLIKLPYSGHPSTFYLEDIGLLKELIIKIANGDDVDGINLSERKRFSQKYLRTLCEHLLIKNHPKWALSAIESAIRIVGKEAETLRLKSAVLERLGRVDEAIDSLKESLYLNPNKVYLFGHLSSLLVEENSLEDALSVIESAIVMDGKNAGFHRLKSSILAKLDRVSES